MFNKIKIEIEGDYIDSFVYSGVLFLIDSELHLKAYSWDNVYSRSLIGIGPFDLMRLKKYSMGNGTVPKHLCRTYSISEKSLKELELCSKNLMVWPSDIDIYKNRFYVASERGVDVFNFSWADGRASNFTEGTRIFDEVSFKLATNSHYRLAIAAGNSGLLSVIPKGKDTSRKYVKQLIDVPCSDCHWQSSTLVANTADGQYTASYLPFPSKVGFGGTETEYWNSVDIIKNTPPKIQKRIEINGETIISSWLAGEGMFSVTKNLNLYWNNVEHLDRYELVETGSELTTLKYFSAQSSPFGTVMEVGDDLKIFTGDGKYHTMAKEAVNWRLFPKSNHYLSHLHVIEEQALSVFIFDMPKVSSKFGYLADKNKGIA